MIAKRRARTLKPEEHEELLRLTEQVEDYRARRVADLIELARLRGTTLADLLRELGIRPPLDA